MQYITNSIQYIGRTTRIGPTEFQTVETKWRMNREEEEDLAGEGREGSRLERRRECYRYIHI